MRSFAPTWDMITGKKLDVRHQHFRGAIMCVQPARTDQGNFEVLCVWYSRTAKRIVVEPYYIITAVYADVLTCTYVLAIKEHLHVSTWCTCCCPWPKKGRKVTKRMLEPLRLNLN